MATSSAKRKQFFVENEDNETRNLSYEIEIENEDNSGQSDVKCVVNVLKKKNRRLDTALRPGQFSVLVKSQHRQDKFVKKGDFTPIKHNSDVIIILSAKTHVESMDVDCDDDAQSTTRKGIIFVTHSNVCQHTNLLLHFDDYR